MNIFLCQVADETDQGPAHTQRPYAAGAKGQRRLRPTAGTGEPGFSAVTLAGA